jgi:hypothetical protein
MAFVSMFRENGRQSMCVIWGIMLRYLMFELRCENYYLSGQKYIPSVELHTFDMNAKNKYVYPSGMLPPANTKNIKTPAY